jgi:hypothetical protein
MWNRNQLVVQRPSLVVRRGRRPPSARRAERNVTTDGLPDDVSSLLRDRLRGLEALETLRCLHAERRAWGVAEVARCIGGDPGAARAALDELRDGGLAAEDVAGQFSYAPGDVDTSATVDRLLDAYARARLEVMRALTDNALGRLRSSAARAFRFGKSRRDG